MRFFPKIIFDRAHEDPSSVAYRFFQGPSLQSDVLTNRELWERAASLAHQLQVLGLSKQRVLLICKSQKYFVISFFACLLAGAIAVPTAPPRRRSLMSRFESIIGNAQPRAIVSDCDEIDLFDFSREAQELIRVDVRLWAQIQDHAAQAALWRMPSLTESAIAFLQYTSGSTDSPKGVAVTHSNLMHNCEAIRHKMAFTRASSIFTSLPLFHDMGLVGGVLESAYVGCSGNCMSPTEFVQFPERWLQIMSKFKFTISGGPNFMYELAARSVEPEKIQDCDLSNWQVAFCGAEPIRAPTIDMFSQKFKPYGFKPESFYPCYGMAESTLFITGNRIGTHPTICTKHGTKVVSCGTAAPNTQIEIVDPHSCELVVDGEIGEIWVSSSSVASEYWQQADLTEKTFQALIPNGDGARFLRTGDLGYIKDGELYVTGRLKDLIILYGKKFAPQDIETEAERCHVALRRAGTAAFGAVRDGAERLVLVSELSREWLHRYLEWPSIVDAIRASIGTAFEVAVDDVILLKPGALPRTSSGKVRRTQCRIDYLDGALGAVTLPNSTSSL